jgi:hypothetical protein
MIVEEDVASILHEDGAIEICDVTSQWSVIGQQETQSGHIPEKQMILRLVLSLSVGTIGSDMMTLGTARESWVGTEVEKLTADVFEE